MIKNTKKIEMIQIICVFLTFFLPSQISNSLNLKNKNSLSFFKKTIIQLKFIKMMQFIQLKFMEMIQFIFALQILIILFLVFSIFYLIFFINNFKL